jgi:ADP-ribose pyrophosphatase
MKKSVIELGSKVIFRTVIFELFEKKLRFLRNNQEVEFYTLGCGEWVNIIALTPSLEAVMIRQYRAGTNSVILETPGGIIDPHEKDPSTAALRELKEETGYTGDYVEPLGFVHPNPALLNNRAYTFLVRDVQLAGIQSLDPLEDIKVELIPIRDIPALMRSGEISHAIVLAAFALLEMKHPELYRYAPV